MRQDGHRDVGPPRLRQRSLHQKVNDEDVGRMRRESIGDVVQMLGARPDVADDGREPLLWPALAVEIEASTTRQGRERQAASFDRSLLRKVAQEADLVASRVQLLGYTDGRWHVAATIPSEESETRHFTPYARRCRRSCLLYTSPSPRGLGMISY